VTSLKTVTIWSSSGYLVKFYWADWSPNVCIVKECANTLTVVWKAVQPVKMARKVWRTSRRDKSAAIGSEKVVMSFHDLWNTERIEWVRRELAQ